MISFNALQSIAVVVLALLLLTSMGVTAKRILGEKSQEVSAESLAFRLAREIDAFYSASCAPGAFCAALLHVPVKAEVSFDGNNVMVIRNGFNASGKTFAPLSQASCSVKEAGEGMEISLRWES